LSQIFVDAREFAELDDRWIIQHDAPEAVLIGPERIGEDEGVEPIILGARDRVSISKAVELLRVDREDVEAPFHQSLHEPSARDLDRHGHLSRLAPPQTSEPVGELRDGGPTVLDLLLVDDLASRIRQADLI